MYKSMKSTAPFFTPWNSLNQLVRESPPFIRTAVKHSIYDFIKSRHSLPLIPLENNRKNNRLCSLYNKSTDLTKYVGNDFL